MSAGLQKAGWLLIAIGLTAFVGTELDASPDSLGMPSLAPSDVRAPTSETLEAYRSQSAYQYERHVDESESIGGRLWRWFRETILAPFVSDRYSVLTRLTLIALVFLVVAFAVFRLLRMERTDVRSRRLQKGGHIEMEEIPIQDRDFREETERAEREGNLRLAVRLRFLTVLRELDRRNLIAFSPDKTNRAYLREVRGSLGDELKKLVRLFEATWYGDYALSPEQYEEARLRFHRFHEHVMGAGE